MSSRSPSPQPPAPKRRRLSSPNKKRNANHSKIMTTEEFLSQPLAAFIDNGRETNQEIADKIVKFFNIRDAGSYAAIVANKKVAYSYNYPQEKSRNVADCRGRWIEVWKQSRVPSEKIDFDQSTVSALVKGLILEHNQTAPVRSALKKALGNCWTVIRAREDCDFAISFSHAGQHTFRKIKIKDRIWTVWRNPEPNE